MKILLRGGIWTNVEDEILKSAIMKYGSNNWARVSSLLSRKSPKQCKARWFEWLDPSIKKTGFSREDDEKLLHLAKLYPAQWRTIAPLVGRTAAQCMDRYEKLLDEAQRELQSEDGVVQGTTESIRSLKPGEIDPAPETRPARPDPVDMNEDEKEMLSEARARLANTRGKKAKRKAREAALGEARRLASLQKRRELKAAGIFSASVHESRAFSRKRKNSGMDYANEIPFHTQPPPGFYDTRHEKSADLERRKEENMQFKAKRLDAFEEETRDEAERKERKKDHAKRTKLMKSDLPKAVDMINRLNDPASSIRRSSLQLPAPMLTDDQVHDLAQQQLKHEASSLDISGLPTDELLDQQSEHFSDRALTARTPKVPRTHDTLAQEAKNAFRSRQLDTPLLGQDEPEALQGTGYHGATPTATHFRSSTKNHILPSQTSAIAGTRNTPLLRDTLRPDDDQLSRDTDSHFSRPASDAPSTSSALSFRRQKREVRLALAAVPEPKYAYDVDIPEERELSTIREEEEEEEEEEQGEAQEEDQAEKEIRQVAAKAAEVMRQLERRTAPVKQDLPRPRHVRTEPFADDPLSREALRLMALDARDFPLPRSTAPPAALCIDDHISDEDLRRARELIHQELATMPPAPDATDFSEACTKRLESTVFFPSTGEWGSVASEPSVGALLEARKASFDLIRAQMAKGANRASRIEARIEPRIQPLIQEADTLRADIEKLTEELDEAVMKTASFARLHNIESIHSLPNRLERAKSSYHAMQQRDTLLQREHKSLLHRLHELKDCLKSVSSSS